VAVAILFRICVEGPRNATINLEYPVFRSRFEPPFSEINSTAMWGQVVFRKMGFEEVNWTELAQNRFHCRGVMEAVTPFRSSNISCAGNGVFSWELLRL
jgi:hypothetical protein